MDSVSRSVRICAYGRPEAASASTAAASDGTAAAVERVESLGEADVDGVMSVGFKTPASVHVGGGERPARGTCDDRRRLRTDESPCPQRCESSDQSGYTSPIATRSSSSAASAFDVPPEYRQVARIAIAFVAFGSPSAASASLALAHARLDFTDRARGVGDVGTADASDRAIIVSGKTIAPHRAVRVLRQSPHRDPGRRLQRVRRSGAARR